MSGGKDNVKRRNMLVAFTIVAVLLVSSVFIMGANAPEQPLSYEKYVKYLPGDATLEDGTAAPTNIIVGYDGIVSTEYNPEYWSGSFIGVNANDYAMDPAPANWFGPTCTVNTNVTLTVSGATSYTVTFADTVDQRHYASYVVTETTDYQNVSISKPQDSHTTEITITCDDTNSHAFSLTFATTVHKVFAGWTYDGEIILPGDVINVSSNATRTEPAVATARWIVPAIYYHSTLTKSGSSTIALSGDDLPRPYLVLQKTNDVVTLPGLDTTNHPFNDTSHNIIEPAKSTYSKMFGHIYLLQSGTNYFGGNGGDKKLPGGTYRSYDLNNLATMDCNNSSSQSNSKVTISGEGGVVFDNINIDNSKDWGIKHGSSSNCSIIAQGHILIMGTGITNSRLADPDNPVNIINNNGFSNCYGTVQIFGGNVAGGGLVDKCPELPVYNDGNNKKIVYADGSEEYNKVATCVIIHSGIYYCVYAGNQTTSIGSNNNWLSTYMVLKGGIVQDTAAGGSFNGTIYDINNGSSFDEWSEDMGGTYLYATGVFMPGDNWQDSKSYEGVNNDKYYNMRKGFINYEASALLGGNDRNAVYGSTHVFITDKASVFDVQAGSRETTGYTGFAYLEISGKAMVRHVACGTLMNAVAYSEKNGEVTSNLDLVGSVGIKILGGTTATVLGAGYDTYFKPTGKTMTKGTITIEMSGGSVENIYGGGYRGDIGTETNTKALTININIKGGVVKDSVYGGGSGGVEKVKHNSNGTFQSAGQKDMSTGRSHVYGTINVSMTGGIVEGDVYGGGMSLPSFDGNIAEQSNVAEVTGDISVSISGGTVKGSVYGGGKGVIMSTAREDGYIQLYDKNGLTLYTKDLSRTVILNARGETITTAWYVTNVTEQNPNGKDYVPNYKDTYLTVSNGVVTGGSYMEFGRVIGNTKVNISGNAYIAGSVYGGGSNGKVAYGLYNDGKGNTTVEIKGGVIGENVFGGGLGTKGITSVMGDRSVFIDIADGNIVIDEVSTPKQIKGSVYGGSAYGNDGPDNYDVDNVYSNSMIVIKKGTIQYDVFGGGLLGKTYGNTYIDVGYTYDANYTPSYDMSSGNRIAIQSIYAGANIDTTNPPTAANLFTESLVMGYGHVTVYGNGDGSKIRITGSIMGSGNSVKTDKDTTVTLDSFQNGAQMEGLHRITNLVLNQTSLNLTGRSSQTPYGSEPVQPLSIFMVDDFTMKWDSSIIIGASIDCVGQYHSLNNNGQPTSVSSPYNKIIYTGGYTFNIRVPDNNGGFTYRNAQGYTLIQTAVQGQYGAYVMTMKDVSGGFTAVKNDIFRLCDYYDIGETAKYWYISGTTKKVITMNMQYGGDGSSTPINAVQSSINLMKLQDDSTLKYVGGVFTTASANMAGDMYTFLKPGTGTQTNQFGFIVGYSDDNSVSNTAYADTQHYLNLGDLSLGEGSSGSRWVSGTYFDGSNSSTQEPVKGSESDIMRVTTQLYPLELYTDGGSGSYSLNFVLVGTPENFTSYVGYLTLTVQETKDVLYTVKEKDGTTRNYTNTMIINTTDIRIDMYVLGNSQGGNSYTVPLKVDLEDGKYKGTTDVVIASGYTLSKVNLTGVSYKDGNGDDLPSSLTNSINVKVKARSNEDKTTGWSIINSTDIVTGPKSDLNIYVGTLLGTMVATIEYEVNNIPEDIDFRDDPVIVLTIDIVQQSGEKAQSIANAALIDRPKYSVTCYHNGVPQAPVYFPEDTLLTADSLHTLYPNFVGWYLDEDYMNPYDYSLPLRSNLNLYARYSYEITFNNMDGSSTKLYVPVNNSGTLLSRSSVPTPTSTGYDFDCWCSDKICSTPWDYDVDVITGDTTLYARWTGNDVWVKFKYGDTYFGGDYGNTYRITLPNGETRYPAVKVGSSFSIQDYISGSPEYVLDKARSIVTDDTDTQKINYIQWRITTSAGTTYYVDKETVLKSDMVDWDNYIPGNNQPNYVIVLEAVPSYISLYIEMSRGADVADASVYITDPKSFLVYPDGLPDDASETSGHWVSTDGKYEYYYDDHGSYYIRESGTYKVHTTVDGDEYWYDKYGRYFTYDEQSGWSPVKFFYVYSDEPTVFWLNGDDHLYYTYDEVDAEKDKQLPASQPYGDVYTDDIYGRVTTVEISETTWTKTFIEIEYKVLVEISNGTPIFTYQKYSVEEGKWVNCDNTPSGVHLEDRYGNEYSLADVMLSELDCTYGSETYYSFTFSMNAAVRNGYTLVGWHNTHVLNTPLYPVSGMERTLKMFFHKDQYDYNDYILINSEVLETQDNHGRAVLYTNVDYDYADVFSGGYKALIDKPYGSFDSYLDIDGYPALNYFTAEEMEKRYHITYQAKWESLNYTVNITYPDSGAIMRVYTADAEGDTTLVDGDVIQNVKYGDRLNLSYSSSGVSKFSRWIVTGDYEIENAYSSNTILIIRGNCSISVSDISEKTTDIMIYFDNGRLSESDSDHVAVFVHKKGTSFYDESNYYEMTGLPGNRSMELYRGSLPLTKGDESYEVIVRWYDNASDKLRHQVNYDERYTYILKEHSPFVVTQDSNQERIYYVISARILPSIFLGETDGYVYTEVPSGYKFKRIDTGELVDISDIRTDDGMYISIWYDDDGNGIYEEDDCIVKINRYVGVNQDHLLETEDIINNPLDEIPPVYMYIKQGYFFATFEGFPSGDHFDLNQDRNYYAGYTFSDTSNDLRFDLNWTRVDKPADIVVKLKDPTNHSALTNYDIDLYVKVGENYVQTAATIENMLYEDAFFGVSGKIPADYRINSTYTYEAVDYKIVGWYYDKEMTIPIESTDVLDFNTAGNMESNRAYRNHDAGESSDQSFMFDSRYQIYAKLFADPKTASVTLEKKNVAGTGYESTRIEDLYFENRDGSYVASFQLKEYSGFHYELADSKPKVVVSNLTDCVVTQLNGIVTISVLAANWSDYAAVQVFYERNTVTLEITLRDYESIDISGGQWTNWTNGKYVAVYGEEVTVPLNMKYGSATTCTKWQKSGVDLTDNNKYTVSDTDSGTIYLTAVYGISTYTVTFTTTIGTFSNGYQTIEKTVPSGQVLDYSSHKPTFDDRAYDLEGYRLSNGEDVIWKDVENYRTQTITSDVEYVAVWTISTHNFHYSMSAGSTADVSVYNGSSNEPLPIGVDNALTHNTEIRITINPPLGKTLDVEGTRGNYSIMGSPTKLSDERGYSWSFLLTKDIDNLQIVIVDKSVNINFYVDGVLITTTPQDWNNMDVTYTGDNEETIHLSWGRNIPMYKTVSFNRYGNLPWYTDSSLTTKYQSKDNGYTFFAENDLDLYTTKNKFLLYLHEDPSFIGSQSDTGRRNLLDITTNRITIPNVTYERPDGVFVGWGVIENGKSVLKYYPGESINVSAMNGRLDLYAYYLKLSDSVEYAYDGLAHYQDVKLYAEDERWYNNLNENGYSAGVSVDIRYNDFDHFSEDWAVWSSDPSTSSSFGIMDVGETGTVYYCINVTTAGGSGLIISHYNMNISKIDVYVFAPSASKANNGQALTVTNNDIIILTNAPDGEMPDNVEITFALKTTDGYSTSINKIGKVRTGVYISAGTDEEKAKCNFYFFDGILNIYDESSSTYEYGGY